MKTNHKYFIIILTIGIIVISIFSWRSIILFNLRIFYNKYYLYTYKCSGNYCITIANESGASFNSSADRYVFVGKFQAIPLIDRDFMKFREDLDLCVVFNDAGRATIYSMYPPELNYISDKVNIDDIKNSPANCPRR